jgi:AAA+ superfamily predicted ATPase
MAAIKTALSKGRTAADDVASLLRARNSLLWIVTREEARVEGFLVEAAGAAGYKTVFWDAAQGVTTIDSKKVQGVGGEDVGTTLAAVRAASDQDPKKSVRQVWVMRDLPRWLGDGMAGAIPLRQLRNLAKHLPGVDRKAAQAIIILTTESNIPADLAGHATVIEWPLPDRSEIEKVLTSAINSLPEYDTDKETGEEIKSKPIRSLATTPETRETAIDAAVGLTAEEAAACFAKSLVQTRTIDPSLVSNEKKRVIARERVLEWVDPIKGGLDAVGGLDNLKDWLKVRKSAYSPAAREYGLPAPKGGVLVGISGCGKSLTAKAIATAWEVPLLRLDLGALQAKYIGESQQNIRKAFKVIEAIGRCVVWIDEIEKAMAGSSSGASDGGVSADALSVVLNWMQERTSEAFVIATANDVEALPPELLRKGRFDEVFYVGLPNATERKGVLLAALRANGREKVKINFNAVVEATDRFTGAEIAELVPSALYAAFEESAREITTADLIEAASNVVPLSKSRADKIAKMEKWGTENARPATRAAARLEVVSGGRQLDL